jgi:hypothetical protein
MAEKAEQITQLTLISLKPLKNRMNSSWIACFDLACGLLGKVSVGFQRRLLTSPPIDWVIQRNAADAFARRERGPFWLRLGEGDVALNSREPVKG